MPKGVYDRSPRMNIQKVSEMPDRQSANANVEAIRQSHGEEEISTTERLFGGPEQQIEEQNEKPLSQEPLKSEPLPQNPEEAEQPKFKESNSPKPAESTPDTDDFIDWDKMSGKKIRQKIDGKEVITTVDELKKYSDQDQIKKHLAEQANYVGDERRKLAEERRQWNEQRNRNQAPQGTPQDFQNPQGIDQFQGQRQAPIQNDPVIQRMQFLEAQIQPVIWQSNRQRVSDELKSQGFNDFDEYWPKIVANTNPEIIQSMNGDEMKAAKFTYFQLKAQDLQKAPARTVNVPRVTPEQSVPATQIDGGSQGSGQYVESSGQNYRTVFRRAVSAGDDKEAWNEVLRQKGILPD